MRYAIFSDIHANLEALSAVLAEIDRLGVDRRVFLGDAIGYGASPNEVCDLLRPRIDVAVLGNHDAAVCGRMDYSDYYDAARYALDWTTAHLSAQNLDWLRGVPYKVREGELDFSHGSPLYPDMFDYLFAAEQVQDLVYEMGDALAHVTFIGHSHLTVSFRVDHGEVEVRAVSQIECDENARHVITVGSVGQPRDRDPRACFGLYDSESRHFEHRRVEYDVHRARQKIIDAGLSPVFGERLLVGV